MSVVDYITNPLSLGLAVTVIYKYLEGGPGPGTYNYVANYLVITETLILIIVK